MTDLERKLQEIRLYFYEREWVQSVSTYRVQVVEEVDHEGKVKRAILPDPEGDWIRLKITGTARKVIDEIEHQARVEQLITIELINDNGLSGRDIAAIVAPQLEEQYEILIGGEAEG